jgi:hypothetical protein
MFHIDTGADKQKWHCPPGQEPTAKGRCEPQRGTPWSRGCHQIVPNEQGGPDKNNYSVGHQHRFVSLLPGIMCIVMASIEL